MLTSSVLALAALSPQGSQPIPPAPDYSGAFVSEALYQDSLIVLVNGDVNHTGPMVRKLLGAQASSGGVPEFGGGARAKVGIKGRIFFLNGTEGLGSHQFTGVDDPVLDPFHPDNDAYRFYVNRGPAKQGVNSNRPRYAAPLPPGVELEDLPELVRYGLDQDESTRHDNLPDEQYGDSWTATAARCPETIAALEWARYLDVPIGFETFRAFNQGGSASIAESDVNIAFEACQFLPFESQAVRDEFGKYQCSWDVSNRCSPTDAPTDLLPNDGNFGNFTFATPTMADPELSENLPPALADKLGARLYYQDYIERNIKDALTQLLTIAAFARNADGSFRYRSPSTGEGLIASFSLESEIRLPAHRNEASVPIPEHPDWAPTVGHRYFIEDYHPVSLLEWQQYLADKYGDLGPDLDSNLDGRTFRADYEADYLDSGWSGVAKHLLADISGNVDWSAVDAPRKYPDPQAIDDPAARTPLWHEWLNFRAVQVDRTIQRYLDWWVEAGVPPTRMFSHCSPARASTFETRSATSLFPPLSKETADQWEGMEVSSGYHGSNVYFLSDIGQRGYLFENLNRRDDGWGSPEWNPYRRRPNPSEVHPTPSEILAVLEDAHQARAHVLNYHGWSRRNDGGAVPGTPAFDYGAYDSYTHYWGYTPTEALEGWTVVGAKVENLPLDGATERWITSVNPAAPVYLEHVLTSPVEAADYPFLVLRLKTFLDAPELEASRVLRVDFQKTSTGSVWHRAEAAILPHLPLDGTHVALDLEAGAAAFPESWSGMIQALRLYPCTQDGNYVFSEMEAWLGGQTPFTAAQQAVLVAQQVNGRPELPGERALAADTRFADQIGSFFHADPNQASLTVYGCEPTPSVDGPQHEDFDYLGNFEPASVTLPTPAGSALTLDSSIRATPPSFLGLTKTGRFRRLRLPDTTQHLGLVFRMGLDNAAGLQSVDGVEFEVRIRRLEAGGASSLKRQLRTLFRREWRAGAWSELEVLDLDPYRGELVDLFFETHSVAETTGDGAVWGDPMLRTWP